MFGFVVYKNSLFCNFVIESFFMFSWQRTCPRRQYALSEKRLRTCTSTFSLCKKRTRHAAMATALCEYICGLEPATSSFLEVSLMLTCCLCLGRIVAESSTGCIFAGSSLGKKGKLSGCPERSHATEQLVQCSSFATRGHYITKRSLYV